MSCSDCHKVNPIPYCFNYLVITDYGVDHTEDYLLYIYDYANARTTVTPVTAAATVDPVKAEGIIQTDYRFQPNHSYRISLKQDNVEQNFTIGETTVCCVDVHVIDDNFEHDIITLSDDGCTTD